VLKSRVIPTLLWKGYGLVKGVGFDSWRRVGPVLPAIKVYNSRDVDELILLDITASIEGRSPDHESVSEFSHECFVPLTVGGGICTLEHIALLLHAGADKISFNTALYSNPDLVDAAARRFGAQCIVASIDVRRVEANRWSCLSHAGTCDTRRSPVDVAREMADRGAGELLLTSVDRDGTMSGYDLDVIARVAQAVPIPVIASGGAGNYQHMVDAIALAGASAVAAASIFHFTEQTPAGAKTALEGAGVPVRRSFRNSPPS
jgi:imidazole glycerol-phosphate synthase subunit HisF